ncbi:MAG: VanZ family protein [Microgenomates group bacterium]
MAPNSFSIKNIFLYWLPLVAWMSAIYYFSSHPHFSLVQQTTFDFILFKTLHMVEYAFLYYLWFRALYQTNIIPKKNTLLAAILLTLLYAISDEYHQTLVPTREGKLRDVVIDFAGIMIIWYYIKSNLRFVTKYLL